MEQLIFKSWKILKSTKLGRWLFSFLIGIFVPYSGSISPQVIEIEKGKSTIRLKEKWFVRNHLKSVHAIALANLGELASGLAMLSALPPNSRGIVRSINIEYLKKARGVLTSKGSANPPQVLTENIEQIAHADIFDSSNELVAVLKVNWQVGPRE